MLSPYAIRTCYFTMESIIYFLFIHNSGWDMDHLYLHTPYTFPKLPPFIKAILVNITPPAPIQSYG